MNVDTVLVQGTNEHIAHTQLDPISSAFSEPMLFYDVRYEFRQLNSGNINIIQNFQTYKFSRITCSLCIVSWLRPYHYSDVIMGAMAYQITSLSIVYSTVYSGADQRKRQSSESLASVRKWPVTRKCFHLMTSSCSTVATSYWTWRAFNVMAFGMFASVPHCHEERPG